VVLRFNYWGFEKHYIGNKKNEEQSANSEGRVFFASRCSIFSLLALLSSPPNLFALGINCRLINIKSQNHFVSGKYKKLIPYFVSVRKDTFLSFRQSFVPESPAYEHEIPVLRFASTGMTGFPDKHYLSKLKLELRTGFIESAGHRQTSLILK